MTPFSSDTRLVSSVVHHPPVTCCSRSWARLRCFRVTSTSTSRGQASGDAGSKRGALADSPRPRSAIGDGPIRAHGATRRSRGRTRCEVLATLPTSLWLFEPIVALARRCQIRRGWPRSTLKDRNRSTSATDYETRLAPEAQAGARTDLAGRAHVEAQCPLDSG
jgi:hypothetical protein